MNSAFVTQEQLKHWKLTDPKTTIKKTTTANWAGVWIVCSMLELLLRQNVCRCCRCRLWDGGRRRLPLEGSQTRADSAETAAAETRGRWRVLQQILLHQRTQLLLCSSSYSCTLMLQELLEYCYMLNFLFIKHIIFLQFSNWKLFNQMKPSSKEYLVWFMHYFTKVLNHPSIMLL